MARSSPLAREESTPAESLALAFLVAVAAVLRLWAIGAKPLWLDEAFSTWVAAHGVLDLVRFTASIDHHPPLYYLLLHWWQSAFGDSARSLRQLSALLGVAAIVPFYLSGRIFVGRAAAYFAALLLAISPFHVRYGQEARMYAQMTFLAAMMLWSLSVYLVDSQGGSSRRRMAMSVLTVSQAALMWTHNTSVFLVPLAVNTGVLLAWLLSTGRDSELCALKEDSFFRGWWTVQAAAIVLWLPWLPSFVKQADAVYARFWIEPLSPYSIWLTFHNFNLAYPEGWFPGSPWWDFVYWSLAAAGLFALRKQLPTAVLLGVLFLAPATVEMVISIWRPILYDRTIIWTTLPYFLLVGSGLGWLVATKGERRLGKTWRSEHGNSAAPFVVGVVVLMLLVALSGYSLRAYFVHYDKENWPAVADYISRVSDQDDLLLFSAAWGQIPFAYAARGRSVPACTEGAPSTLFEAGELEPAMSAGDVAALQALIGSYDDVWLVYTHEWYADPSGLVPQTIAATHELVEERVFSGPRVLHYARFVAHD